MHYFSYGSNMSSRRLLSRIPGATFVTTAVLAGHKLCFHKKGKDGSAKCDAYETLNSQHLLHGVVYDITLSQMGVLDRIEGVGAGYERKNVELIAPSGKPVRAFTYYATHIDSSIRPYHWYKKHVLTGALEYGLPGLYLDKLKKIDSMEDPDLQRHATEMAIYRDSPNTD